MQALCVCAGICDLTRSSHWIDTLVLKTEGNTYHRRATSPFPLRGNTNARLQGHGGNPLHIFLGSPLRRSRSRRIHCAVAEEYQDKNSLPSARFWCRWKVFCCISRSISGAIAGEGEIYPSRSHKLISCIYFFAVSSHLANNL